MSSWDDVVLNKKKDSSSSSSSSSSMGACGQLDRALDKKVWGSIPTAGHVWKCRASASAHPAAMGTWWN